MLAASAQIPLLRRGLYLETRSVWALLKSGFEVSRARQASMVSHRVCEGRNWVDHGPLWMLGRPILGDQGPLKIPEGYSSALGRETSCALTFGTHSRYPLKLFGMRSHDVSAQSPLSTSSSCAHRSLLLHNVCLGQGARCDLPVQGK